jgi:hypothetical protein
MTTTAPPDDKMKGTGKQSDGVVAILSRRGSWLKEKKKRGKRRRKRWLHIGERRQMNR